MSRRNLERRIAALGLAAMLALPGAALARPGRAAESIPWSSLWIWLARLAAGISLPAGLRHPTGGGMVTATGKSGSTVDPDGRTATTLLVTEPPATDPTTVDSPDGTTQ